MQFSERYVLPRNLSDCPFEGHPNAGPFKLLNIVSEKCSDLCTPTPGKQNSNQRCSVTNKHCGWAGRRIPSGRGFLHFTSLLPSTTGSHPAPFPRGHPVWGVSTANGSPRGERRAPRAFTRGRRKMAVRTATAGRAARPTPRQSRISSSLVAFLVRYLI